MTWRDKTVTFGELARLAREEVVPNPMGPFDEGVNTGIESLVRAIGSESNMDDGDQVEMMGEARGEAILNRLTA